MGSKGSKPRKPKHSQHLPKVGTATENERLLHEEQHAVAAQMGVGNASPYVRIIVMTLVIVLFAAAIIAFLGLVVFD